MQKVFIFFEKRLSEYKDRFAIEKKNKKNVRSNLKVQKNAIE